MEKGEEGIGRAYACNTYLSRLFPRHDLHGIGLAGRLEDGLIGQGGLSYKEWDGDTSQDIHHSCFPVYCK